jgi:hypothetical protein
MAKFASSATRLAGGAVEECRDGGRARERSLKTSTAATEAGSGTSALE